MSNAEYLWITIEKLQNEVKKLRLDVDGTQSVWLDVLEQNEKMKAEVSKLKMEESKLLTFTETLEGEITELSEDRQSLYLRSESFADQILELKAENERLLKAGDAMLDTAIQDSTGLWLLPAFENWIKAKEKTEKEIGAIAKETLSKEGRDAK